MFASNNILKTGVYRTRSPISKLQFRLTIQKIHSLIDIPTMKGLNMNLNKEEIPENNSKESRLVYWQEKVFSQHEIKYYGFKENCKTERQKLYYKRFKLESNMPSMLFTYVEGDNFSPDDLDNQTQHRLTDVLLVDKQSMYLMADLGEDVLMFSIQWFPKEGMLLVYPDFNRMSIDPYYHEVRGSNLQMYHYSLEKCTAKGNILEAHNIPTHVVATSMKKTLDALPLARDERFIMPKHLKQNLLILLEIVSASEFKYDKIHVRYQIVLPTDVKTTEENATLLGSTHSSKNNIGNWQFGHCHELFLIMSECEEMHNSILSIFFEVIAIDSCQREKYLGFCHLSIQLRPTKSEVTLNVIKLTHCSMSFDRLEEFLVGNRREIDLTSFYGKKNISVLSRYGHETIASGNVKIRYQVVRQHQPNVLNEGFYKANIVSKNVSLTELVAKYNAARERLEEFVELQY
ncbi:uncharacterized protein LOC131293677 [Anopheles ziemanni]|uniref:uncharacterized protein LOC131264461 n=1 Tax=Anopheles coustani TaxID=139045 RepID=UPI0026584D72|nr:uncharacterized protein LOC131264461 [Anopheles coustani]XP_058177735.1 uncharacterized protein LOC131293677 [Anopheles ziemanni]